MNQVPLIALAGGPCAGKTTALVRLTEFLLERGKTPLIAREAATDLIDAGRCIETPLFAVEEHVDLFVIEEELIDKCTIRIGPDGVTEFVGVDTELSRPFPVWSDLDHRLTK